MVMKSLNTDPKSTSLYYSAVIKKTTAMLTVHRTKEEMEIIMLSKIN